MNLNNYFWIFKEIIPPRICDEILRLGKSNSPVVAVTGAFSDKGNLNKKQLKSLKKKRDSNVVWLNSRWIWNLIQPLVYLANHEAGWNFQWDQSEVPQFTKYSRGQYYGWHCDSWDKPYHSPGKANHNKIRKISTILLLSDSSEYKGGELEVNTRQNDLDEKKEIVARVESFKGKGTIICFPSFLWHRVRPITKGIRYSLPTWHLGCPWK